MLRYPVGLIWGKTEDFKLCLQGKAAVKHQMSYDFEKCDFDWFLALHIDVFQSVEPSLIIILNVKTLSVKMNQYSIYYKKSFTCHLHCILKLWDHEVTLDERLF